MVAANLVQARIEQAREARNPFVLARMASGWLVIGDRQPTAGYCLLLADPIVANLNELDREDQAAYLRDMSRAGSALLRVTGAQRINYETLGNEWPALHTHITPRYRTESRLTRKASPALLRVLARRTTSDQHRRLKALMLAALGP